MTGVWVYEHRRSDGCVLYVGQTINPRSRTSDHRRRAAWWPLVTSITWRRYATREMAGFAERSIIARLSPPFNAPPEQRTERIRAAKEARRAAA